MAGVSPAFQFYPQDWLSSNQVVLMTAEERGVYIQLLCHCWTHDECGLPDDNRILAAYGGIQHEERTHVEQVLNNVRVCFQKHPENETLLTNGRLWKLRQEQLEKREARRRAGVKSGESRRKRTNTCSTHVEQTTNKTRTNANTSTSSSNKKKSSKRKSGKDGSPSWGEGVNPSSLGQQVLGLLADHRSGFSITVLAQELEQPVGEVRTACTELAGQGRIEVVGGMFRLKSKPSKERE